MNQINKIQDYLRLNHPTLWNLKIVHALTLGVLGNLILFGLGYITTTISQKVNFSEGYYRFSSYTDDPGVLYFFAFIFALLSFIVWLVFYFRNNRVKRFYPITSKKLYIEWLLSFLIISSFCLYPLSVLQGSKAKKRSYMTEQEANNGIDFLDRIAILNPQNAMYLSDSLQQVMTHKEVERYRYGSLLNFDEYDYKYNYAPNLLYVSTKAMLVQEDSVGIRRLMDEYIIFQEKYIPQSSLSTDMWMDAIYFPPNYIIDKESKICLNLDKELHIGGIRRLHNSVKEGYNNNDFWVQLLLSLFFGLSISITVFGCRMTSGKSWLIALVVHFVVLLLTALLQFGIGTFFGYLILWLFIYIAYVIYVVAYTKNNGYKGKTPILMNLIITYSSVLLLFIYGVVYSIADEVRNYIYDDASGLSRCTNDELYNFLNEWNMHFMWASLLLTIPLMYVVVKWSLKWKALPEE